MRRSAQRSFCYAALWPCWMILLGAVLLHPAPARAEQPQQDPRQQQGLTDAEIARRLTNPIAQIVAIPIDFYWDHGVGPEKDLRLTVRVRPLIPVPVTDSWTVIGHFRLPMISQPVLVEGGEPHFGLGDLILSLYVSPNRPGRLVWGLGPIFTLPMGTDPMLGQGKWQAGPTGAGILIFRQAVMGLIAEHLWSFANTGDVTRDDVSRSVFRALAAYTTLTATTFSLSSQMLVDWNAAAGEKLMVPILAEVRQIVSFGALPLSIGLGGGYFVERPTGGPVWRLSLSFSLSLIKRQTRERKKNPFRR